MLKLRWKLLLLGSAVLTSCLVGLTVAIAQPGLIRPGDRDFEDLQEIGDRYSCEIDNTPLTREDFAAAIDRCLQNIEMGNLSEDELDILERLLGEYEAELAALSEAETELEAGEERDRDAAENPPPPQLPRAVPPPVGDISIRNAPPLEQSSGYGRRDGSVQNSPGYFPPAEPAPRSGNIGFSDDETGQEFNREEYNPIDENPFLRVGQNPLSTFSIDVDGASYSNVRRFISNNQMPPMDAVRIEELINYFTYDYPDPEGDDPFAIVTEVSRSPWSENRQLVHVGLQGERIATEDLPPSNLVFLLDVSGSMNEPNKLPLLKAAFRLLVNELDEDDRVSIVVYAGAAGVVLEPTRGDEKDVILDAIERLQAGGSTAGGEGINLAYDLAREHFIDDGNNRIILATDGDFNVGTSSEAELIRLIEEQREDDIFLSVLGFGTGNLQDAKMEQIANHGNGNYSYIDTILEAKKVMVNEMGGTLLTIAKDVKIQVEFNPAKVQAYRLIGYENRLLRDEDFNDDTKDAGELGAGHSVTALYEIIPTGVDPDVELPEVDELRYQQTDIDPSAYDSDELMLVKLRYKEPTGDTSQLLERPVIDADVALNSTSEDFRFAAAVAAFGMILRDSEYKGDATIDMVVNLADESRGDDEEGYRDEFVRLVRSYRLLANL